jgi:hypothetical protein
VAEFEPHRDKAAETKDGQGHVHPPIVCDCGNEHDKGSGQQHDASEGEASATGPQSLRWEPYRSPALSWRLARKKPVAMIMKERARSRHG